VAKVEDTFTAMLAQPGDADRLRADEAVQSVELLNSYPTGRMAQFKREETQLKLTRHV
jgi:hypothetical protein